MSLVPASCFTETYDDSLHGCKLASSRSLATRLHGLWVEFEIRAAGLCGTRWFFCFCSKVVGAVSGYACGSRLRDRRRSASIGGGKDRREGGVAVTFGGRNG